MFRRALLATLIQGGVPERTNGAVLKTAAPFIGRRGFESHPRRSATRFPRNRAGLGPILGLGLTCIAEPLATARNRWRVSLTVAQLSRITRPTPRSERPSRPLRQTGTRQVVLHLRRTGSDAGSGEPRSCSSGP